MASMRLVLLSISTLLLLATTQAYAQKAVVRSAIHNRMFHCVDDRYYDSASGTCVERDTEAKNCPNGYWVHEATRQCQPMAQLCVAGTVYDTRTGVCENIADHTRMSNIEGCPVGYVYVGSEGVCRLRSAINRLPYELPVVTPGPRPKEHSKPVPLASVINPASMPVHNVPMDGYQVRHSLPPTPWNPNQQFVNPAQPTSTLTGNDANNLRGTLVHGNGLQLNDEGGPTNVTPSHNVPMPGYLYGR